LARIFDIAALIFGLSTIAAGAHDTGNEFDRFENAIQCAGMWYGDYAALTLKAPDDDRLSDAGESLAYARSFREYALSLGEGSAEEVDYLISVWQADFFRLAADGGGSWQYPPSEGGYVAQWASVQFTRHARHCQGFGLTLGPAWGFH
jgi:hypothetical protein